MSGPVAGSTDRTLIVLIHRRRRIARRHHRMHVTMAADASRQFHAGHMSDAFRAMYAYGLFGDNIGVTVFAVNRVEAAPVPTVGADMAIETLAHAVHRELELYEVYFMTIVTAIRLFFIARQRHERHADKKEDWARK